MKNFQDIVRQHPQSVAFVFSKYGHGRLPVSEKALAAMAIKYKEPLVHDVAAAVTDNYDVYHGTNGGLFAKLKTKIRSKKNRPAEPANYGQREQVNRIRINSITPITHRVNTAIMQPPTSVPEGRNPLTTPVQQPLPVAKEKRSVYDWVKKLVTDAVPIYNSIKNSKTDTIEDPIVKQVLGGQKPEEKNNKLIWIAIAIIAALAIFLYVLRNKKTIK